MDELDNHFAFQSRRAFLKQTAMGFGTLALSQLLFPFSANTAGSKLVQSAPGELQLPHHVEDLRTLHSPPPSQVWS